MSYDAPPPPYSRSPNHQTNNPYHNQLAITTDNRNSLDEKGPRIVATNAETLAEAQQHAQHTPSTKESENNEQAALDESLSWIVNANRQPHAGVHASLAVSQEAPRFRNFQDLTSRAAPSRDTTNGTGTSITLQPRLGSDVRTTRRST